MFGSRITLFRLFGIPVGVDMSWFIIVVVLTWILSINVFPAYMPDTMPYEDYALTYWLMGLAGTLGLFLSVVIHEFGHALTAQRYGIEMAGITLFIFGGVAEMRSEPPHPLAEFAIAIAGPIASVVLSGLFFLTTVVGQFAGFPLPVIGVTMYLGFINFVLVVFNMVPAFPLDGGRVLRAILWHWRGSIRWATRITSRLGLFFGAFLIIMGVLMFVTGNFIGGAIWVGLGLFLRMAANMSYQQVIVRRALEGEDLDRFVSREPVTVPLDLPLDRFVEDYVYRHYHKLYPVVENGRLVGCVTTKRLQGIPREEWSGRSVGDLVQECGDANTIPFQAEAVDALAKMNREGVSRLMVVHGDQLVGIVTLKDLLRFLSLRVELEEGDDAGLARLEERVPD